MSGQGAKAPEHGRRAAGSLPAMLAAGILALFVTAGLLATQSRVSGAEEITFLRIGTGSVGGVYFPIGGVLASAFSNPPGSRPCDRGGSCGVPGLIAVAQSTKGSVDNVQALSGGMLDLALSQADVAYQAHNGTGTFEDTDPLPDLRAIANLYPEVLHLVVPRDAGILSVRDLEGRRVALGVEGSGTRVDALLVLDAHGIGIDDITASNSPPVEAADLMRRRELDALFMIAGYPATAIRELADAIDIRLVPIEGPEASEITARHPFFGVQVIPEGQYRGTDATPTLSVGAQLLTVDTLDEATIYGITRALWHDSTRRLLDNGHPQGRRIVLQSALQGVAIPLHRGAERYYREIGLLTD